MNRRGFLLGFLSVFAPLGLFLSASASAENIWVWLGLIPAAAVGGAAAAAMSRRRPAQGTGRGLLLALVAWTASLGVLTLVLGAGMFYVAYFLLPFFFPMGLAVGAVLGRLLGPSLPHPNRVRMGRFEAAQLRRTRHLLTSRSRPD
jgi:hypothetical protein